MATPYDAEGCKHLNYAIDTTPIIDNHAHPLLKPEFMDIHPLVSIVTEANGDALKDSWSSLAHIRAVKQLSKILGCKETWEAVEAAIKKKRANSHEEWIRQCLEGIETILVDDGLGMPQHVEGYSWHDSFTTSKCKRIVRIESVAEDIIARHCEGLTTNSNFSEIANMALRDILRELENSCVDPEVVGFKSVICYRVGLDISPYNHDAGKDAVAKIFEEHASGYESKNFIKKKRIQHPALNHWLANSIAEVIDDTQSKKPLQFHTGLGDNDIILSKSSPSHMQDYIRRWPGVPIVLLHASYPWTREAGYLAAMYPNVYADIGEVFPFINQQGQEAVVKQILELCPWSKILWSTDGHFFPETYLLATTQMRTVLKTVLGEMVQTRQLDQGQAVQLVQDILFNNSKKLYDFNVSTTLPSFSHIQTLSSNALPSKMTTDDVLTKLHALNPRFLRIYWHDYTSTARCRLIPMHRVYKILEAGKEVTISLTRATLGLLQIDTMIPQINASGSYTVYPDWSTLRPGPADGHVSCQGDFREEDGSQSALCPRTILRGVLEKAASKNLSFLMGFEVEFLILERNLDPTSPEKYRTLRNDGHSWSRASTLADWGREEGVGSAIEEMLARLDEAGIAYEQFHSENAPGQYELVLAPLTPLEACDGLLHARQILESVAARHGYRVTLHPKPFPMACGTASHMHISVTSSTSKSSDDPSVYEPFYAGILHYLPGLAALLCSNPTSYMRQNVDSAFAGGKWVAWGTQNKEAPLRKCDGSHWEIKMLDGLANPYFAAAGIIATGTHGLISQIPLTLKDCLGDPAKIGEKGRAALGITTTIPANLDEALEALEESGLGNLLGEEFVRRYIDVKNAEVELFTAMPLEDLRQWVMERY
ncbi:glutamine synthetase/guanido kinase [Xylariaceae sp. FL0255]|nr:glutamine synthetase/guanido kinase [Xylariaceae sp. FL0255]